MWYINEKQKKGRRKDGEKGAKKKASLVCRERRGRGGWKGGATGKGKHVYYLYKRLGWFF